MQSKIRRTIVGAVAVLCLGLPAAGASAAPRHKHRRLELPADYAAWTQVAKCESGGWRVLGSSYPDAFGITAANFHQFGGRGDPPGPLSLKQRVAEIRVADRFIHHYGIPIPDNGGCHGSW